MAQFNSHAASGLQVRPASGSKNRLCLITTSGVTWHTVPTQLPIAVIRQPGNMLQTIINRAIDRFHNYIHILKNI